MYKLNKKIKTNRGMTYLELIVVLGIFTIMLSIALFNYDKFQAKVDIKNLVNDIALKLVQAQKDSLSGKWRAGAGATWKPAYGMYFNTTTAVARTKFINFVDLNSTNLCDNSGANCTPPYGISGEVLDVVTITKGNLISSLQIVGTGCPATVNSATIVFRRPSSIPIITTTPPLGGGCALTYLAINISSPQAINAPVKLYPSGRIQIN